MKNKAFGTAALRTASNGNVFVAEVFSKTGLNISLIDGIEEARLIQKGVEWAVPLTEENCLVMDIGGGSVEFIICNKNQLVWSHSFPVGVAVLYKNFQKNDPLLSADIAEIYQFLQQSLTPLRAALLENPTQHLVGASGTFDVIESLVTPIVRSESHAVITVQNCLSVYQDLIGTTINERLTMNHLPPERAEMMAVALVLIKYVLDEFEIDQLTISDFALKEGILREMIASD